MPPDVIDGKVEADDDAADDDAADDAAEDITQVPPIGELSGATGTHAFGPSPWTAAATTGAKPPARRTRFANLVLLLFLVFDRQIITHKDHQIARVAAEA